MTVAATFCATLVDEWVRAGVTDAVVCPGSRSTPLALALAADERIRVHVHHDERSGAFMALGLGLATRRPAVVLTTSGTAAAELHPAVAEADLAGVPLLACTADRPSELHHVGAPQTLDQQHLFGRAARWYADPGPPDETTSAMWRSLAARCVVEATGARPGPVHLHLQLREPLVGASGPLPPARPGGAPWHRAASVLTSASIGPLPAHPRGVIVAGEGTRGSPALAKLAAAVGWPILADARSGLRDGDPVVVSAFDGLLRVERFAAAHRPDVVLRVGQPPASKVLAQWLAGLDAVQIAVDPYGRWADPERTADVVVHGPVDEVAELWLDGARRPDAAWLGAWCAAEAAAQEAIDTWLAGHPEPTEPGVARVVTEAVDASGALVVASSMPVRDVEWFGAPRAPGPVFANRGANGIDGVVSTAVGVALTGAPTIALVGDIAFLHDTNALLGLARRPVDLTVVVVDNDGGGIFHFLPQASAVSAERFELLFGTPHGVDLAALCAAHGVPCADAGDLAELSELLAARPHRPSARVVRVRTNRQENVEAHALLNAAIAAAVERVIG